MSIMVVESGARRPSVLKVLEVGLVFVFVMVVAKDVNTKGVGRARKAARIFAKRMAVGDGARGVNRKNPAVKSRLLVISLLEGKPVFVLHIVKWFKIMRFMHSRWTNRSRLWRGMTATPYRKGGFMAAV